MLVEFINYRHILLIHKHFIWLPSRNMINDMLRFEPKKHLLVWVLGCNMVRSLAVWGSLLFVVV